MQITKRILPKCGQFYLQHIYVLFYEEKYRHSINELVFQFELSVGDIKCYLLTGQLDPRFKKINITFNNIR